MVKVLYTNVSCAVTDPTSFHPARCACCIGPFFRPYCPQSVNSGSEMDQSFWLDQLTAAKAMVVAYNAAILALATGNILSYTLDTSQSRQTVTRNDLASLRATRDALLNEVATLEARLYGCGTVTAAPAW